MYRPGKYHIKSLALGLTYKDHKQGREGAIALYSSISKFVSVRSWMCRDGDIV